MSNTACPRHGLLNNERRCPHCDKRTYDLGNEDERGTLLAVRKVTERPRRIRYMILAAVAFVIARGALGGVMTNHYNFTLDGLVAVAAAAGFALAWAARRPSMHRLDRALGLALL